MTGAAVGLQTVFGLSDFEPGYGTPATVDRFLEIISESMQRRHIQLVSQGIRGGSRNLRRGARRAVSGRDAGGDVNLEVATTGFGRLFEAILGTAPVITNLGGSPVAYRHVYSLGSVLGRSVTLQKQLFDETPSLLQTLTYPGSKIMAAEFSIAVNQFLGLKLTVDSQDERSNIAAATPSYTTQKLFDFSQASLSVASSAVANVLAASVKLDNQQKTDRRFLGNQGLKGEPTDNGFPTLDGSLTVEVLDTTLYDLFAADTAAALSMVFTGANISGANNESLTIDIPEIHLTGKSPEVGGPGTIENQLPFEAAANASNAAGMKITIVTKDAAA